MISSQTTSYLAVRFLSTGESVSAWTPDTLCSFINALWPQDGLPSHFSENIAEQFEAYFAYLRRECDRCDPNRHAARTFQDLIQILDIVKANIHVSKAALCQKVRSKHSNFLEAEDHQIAASIDLSVRLCFMVNIRDGMPSQAFSLQTVLHWPHDASLMSVMETWQGRLSTQTHTIDSKYPTIPDLEKIAAIKVRWTDNMLDHLRLNNQTLYVFHHVSALERLQGAGLRYGTV